MAISDSYILAMDAMGIFLYTLLKLTYLFYHWRQMCFSISKLSLLIRSKFGLQKATKNSHQNNNYQESSISFQYKCRNQLQIPQHSSSLQQIQQSSQSQEINLRNRSSSQLKSKYLNNLGPWLHMILFCLWSLVYQYSTFRACSQSGQWQLVLCSNILHLIEIIFFIKSYGNRKLILQMPAILLILFGNIINANDSSNSAVSNQQPSTQSNVILTILNICVQLSFYIFFNSYMKYSKEIKIIKSSHLNLLNHSFKSINNSTNKLNELNVADVSSSNEYNSLIHPKVNSSQKMNAFVSSLHLNPLRSKSMIKMNSLIWQDIQPISERQLPIKNHNNSGNDNNSSDDKKINIENKKNDDENDDNSRLCNVSDINYQQDCSLTQSTKQQSKPLDTRQSTFIKNRPLSSTVDGITSTTRLQLSGSGGGVKLLASTPIFSSQVLNSIISDEEDEEEEKLSAEIEKKSRQKSENLPGVSKLKRSSFNKNKIAQLEDNFTFRKDLFGKTSCEQLNCKSESNIKGQFYDEVWKIRPCLKSPIQTTSAANDFNTNKIKQKMKSLSSVFFENVSEFDKNIGKSPSSGQIPKISFLRSCSYQDNQRINKKKPSVTFQEDEQFQFDSANNKLLKYSLKRNKSDESAKLIKESSSSEKKTLFQPEKQIIIEDCQSKESPRLEEDLQQLSILNNLDMAVFKLTLGGNWKIDFANTPALQLIDKNKCKDTTSFFKNIIIRSFSKQSFTAITKLGLFHEDYKYSPQIMLHHRNSHTSKTISPTTPSTFSNRLRIQQNELMKYAQNTRKGSLTQSPLYSFGTIQSPSKEDQKMDSSLAYLNSSQKELSSVFDSSIRGSQQFSQISIYQLISKIKNKIKMDFEDSASSLKCSDFSNINLMVETFSLQEGVKLFSSEDIIKIIVIKKKEIVIIIENMSLYYDCAKNQLTKRIQNTMLQTISHEVGTYLSILLSNISAALYDEQVTEYIKQEYIQTLQQNVLLIHLLIQDFRDYQDILQNRLLIKLTRVDIQQLLQNTLQLMEKQAKDKQISLKIELQQDIDTHIFVDSGRFQQILANLLQNSLKFSNSNTTITVKLALTEDGEHLKVSVSDEGIGMTEEEQINLKRLLLEGVNENKISINSSGYGFGLTVSNKIAYKLNQEIYKASINEKSKIISTAFQQGVFFDSVKGQGSTFWFLLSLNKNIIATQQHMSALNSHCLPNKIVLQASLVCLGDNNYLEIENKHFVKSPKARNSVKFSVSHSEIKLDTQLDSLPLDKRLDILEISPSLSHSDLIKVTPNANIVKQFTFNKKTIQKDQFSSSFSSFGNMLHDENHERTLNKESEIIQLQSSDHIALIPDSQIEQQSLKVVRAIQSKNQRKNQEITPDQFHKDCKIIIQDTFTPLEKGEEFILIVDDIQTNHSGLVILLEKVFKIPKKIMLHAYNGSEGLNLVSNYENKIKLIFMDLNMPIMNGHLATQQIRALEDERNLTSLLIIAYTAYSDLQTEQDCLSGGFNQFLTKPILDNKKLEDILIQARLLGQHS